MVYASYAFLLLIIVASSYADIPKCNRNVGPIDNFDSSKMKGTWYSVEVNDEQKSKKSCLTAKVLSETGTSSEKLILKETGHISGKFDEVDVSLTQISNSQYLAKSREIGKAPTLVSVIDTDYISYSTWYQCKNGHKQDGVIYVATRSRKPSAEVMKKAHDSIIKAGFEADKADLFTVDHSNC